VILPTKARYAPGEPVLVSIAAPPIARDLWVEHLGDEVRRIPVAPGAAGEQIVDLGPLPEGGYGVRLCTRDGSTYAQTAVEVLADPVARMRYGFVANFAPDRDVDGVLRWFRRLHLTAAQFYDWAYRHANLVGPDLQWTDPLGQPVSLATVTALATGLRAGGTLPIGYAAVYGVGHDEWPAWRQAALLDATGQPHTLADFLSIVDPSDPQWLAHFRVDLRRAVQAGGFAGFHLDQYGFPRRAVRPDGRVVDLAEAFDTLIRAVRAELPDARLIFNNVNDFPVWVTTRSPQDVTYTEVWEPHDTLADLAAVATRSRALAPHRPVVLAAYQSVFAKHPARAADAATRLTMATLFSHGATQLLAGEDGRLLVDPYYVRNHRPDTSTMDRLARWYDFLVAAGDLLFAEDQADITRSVVGGHNGEIDVASPEAPVSHEPRPGVIWRRVVQTPLGTVVHLINLTGQTETGWDTPKAEIVPVGGLRLRVRPTGTEVPRLHVADPDAGVAFAPLPLRAEDGCLYADLPPLRAWQVLLIRPTDRAARPTSDREENR
jgi:TM1410 hypothetical-related protein.